MAFGVKTNERPGTRAQVRYVRFSAYKAREVLDLIRDEPVGHALDILQFSERDPAIVIRKCLASAVANAEHNDAQSPDELYVSSCYADEGPTLKRWRPRARGRATRIRKRTCHITVIVSRYSEAQLQQIRHREDAKAASGGKARGRDAATSRRRRVARSRGEDPNVAAPEVTEPAAEAPPVDETEASTDDTGVDVSATDRASTDTDETGTDEAGSDDAVTDDTVTDDTTDEASTEDGEQD